MTGENWTRGIQPGYRTKTIKAGCATVIIHRPDLTAVEQACREDEIKRAVANCTAAERQ